MGVPVVREVITSCDRRPQLVVTSLTRLTIVSCAIVVQLDVLYTLGWKGRLPPDAAARSRFYFCGNSLASYDSSKTFHDVGGSVAFQSKKNSAIGWLYSCTLLLGYDN